MDDYINIMNSNDYNQDMMDIWSSYFIPIQNHELKQIKIN